MKHKIFIAILVIFIATRFLAFGQMYHQDEYKWGMIVNPVFNMGLESNHPPLVSAIYTTVGAVVGYDHLRIVPIVFSSLCLILVYLLVCRLHNRRAAVFATSILLLNTYYFIASTQVDIDGALLPFFSLLAIYSFYRIDFLLPKDRKNYSWYGLLFISVVLGLLIKLSFVLVILTLLTEYYLLYRPDVRKITKIALGLLLAGVGASIGAIILNKIYNVVGASDFIAYITKFGVLNFANRNYFQVLFLSIKSIVLASPLLVLLYIVILSKKDYIKEYRFWLIFLVYNLLFYFVIFDFTNRTIERYMMFLIIPGAVIAGSFLARNLEISYLKLYWKYCVAIIAASFIVHLLFTQVIPTVLPLNPKTAYLEHIKSLDFNFLIPITGGSGPVGFYVFVSYVIFCFILVAGVLIVWRFVKNGKWAQILLFTFLINGVIYNGFLSVEFVSGMQYGSADKVARSIAEYVVSSPNVPKVITYYDVGGYELNLSNKYQRRFYTDPMYSKTARALLETYKGYYMILDFPEIDKTSFYWKYLSACPTSFEFVDKLVHGYIFDCQKPNK